MGKAEGTELPNFKFCAQGKTASLCPPKTCRDIPLPPDPDPLIPKDCYEILREDSNACSKATYPLLSNVYCRKTCGLCSTGTPSPTFNLPNPVVNMSFNSTIPSYVISPKKK